MSVERETRRALRRVALWRSVTAALELAAEVAGWPGKLFAALDRFFVELSRVSFAHENDAARRYFALTGLDLARVDGDDDRYRELRVAAGAEERETYEDQGGDE